MKRLIILTTLISMVAFFSTFVEADVTVPVKFESIDFKDLGNFHGQVAVDKNQGWAYWGAREPIVTGDWVLFPFKGKYRFKVESKSDQFDAADTKADIWAEFDVRLYPQKKLKKLAKSIADLNVLKGNPETEMILVHGKAKADSKAGDPWFIADLTSELELEKGEIGQLAIWFTNDKWQPDPPPAKDRNLHIRSMEVLLPKGINLAVEPSGKLAITWGRMKNR